MLHIDIKYRGIVVPGVGKRTINNAIKAAWRVAGTYWFTHFRKKHFTRAGFTEYGYTPRGDAYRKRKIKKTGQDLPLVFTGATREKSKVAKIRHTNKGVRMSMSLPNLTFSIGDLPDLAGEMKTISPREKKILSREIHKEIRKRIRQVRRSKVKKLA